MKDQVVADSMSKKISQPHEEPTPNFHDFALQVSYVVAMEEGGKLSQEKAFKKLKKLWKQLKSQNKPAA